MGGRIIFGARNRGKSRRNKFSPRGCQNRLLLLYFTTEIEVFRNPQPYQKNQKEPEKDLGGENDKRPKNESPLDKRASKKKEARKE